MAAPSSPSRGGGVGEGDAAAAAAAAAPAFAHQAGNPFGADESFQAEDFLDMKSSTTLQPQSMNPFISPQGQDSKKQDYELLEGFAESFAARNNLVDEELKANGVEDTFRSAFPDDDFDATGGSPLFVESPFDESKLVPITTEKESIISNFKQFNLDSSELQLISNLPDAVAKAALEQIQKRQEPTRMEAEEEEEEEEEEMPEPEHYGGGDEGERRKGRGEDTPTPASLDGEQDAGGLGVNLDRAGVEALDDRLQHIEEVVVSLKDNERERERERVSVQDDLALVKEQQLLIVQKDEVIKGLVEMRERETKEKELLLAKLEDMMDERDVNEKVALREQSSVEEVARVVEEYESSLERSKQEKKELLDRVEYLLGERRDFNKLESNFEALRNDNLHLQEALHSERQRLQTYAKEIRDYSLINHETSSMCTEYKSKLEKAESDIQSLKEYIVEYNSSNYNQRLQIEDLVRENKLLQAETVNLKLDLANHQEEIARLSKEVRVLEAYKQKLLLSPQKAETHSNRPRDSLSIKQTERALEIEKQLRVDRFPNPYSKQAVVLAPNTATNITPSEPFVDSVVVSRGPRGGFLPSRSPNDHVAEVVSNPSGTGMEYSRDLSSEESTARRIPVTTEHDVKENIRAAHFQPTESGSVSVSGAGAASVPDYKHSRSARASSKTYPYAIDESKAEGFNDEVQKLEKQLLKMNMEKQCLESQYAKMPASSGRTLAQRKQKRDIEARLTSLNKEISSCRLVLKRLNAAQ